MSFKTKEITLHTPKRIILQDKNGPCPLLAIANTLILLEGLAINEQIVTPETLIAELQDRTSTDLREYNHCLLDGLDANPRFDGSFEGSITDFFALFGLQLVHGWVIPDSFPSGARTLSYDQVMDKIVSNATDSDVIMTQSFIDTHPSQLSPDGIKLLESTLGDGDVVVLFRNNHYSTLVKHKDLLLTLVTDQGFASYSDIVWESLDGGFYQANFQQRQDCSRDEEIARQLQKEEERGRGGSGRPIETRDSNNKDSNLRESSGSTHQLGSGSLGTGNAGTRTPCPDPDLETPVKHPPKTKRGKCIIV